MFVIVHKLCHDRRPTSVSSEFNKMLDFSVLCGLNRVCDLGWCLSANYTLWVVCPSSSSSSVPWWWKLSVC